MPNHDKCEWTVHTSRLLMSKNSIKNVLENLFLLFGRGKTQNRAKTHRPSMSAFSAIFVLKENGTQSHSAKFLNWGDHVNSVPDLDASPPWLAPFMSESKLEACTLPWSVLCHKVERKRKFKISKNINGKYQKKLITLELFIGKNYTCNLRVKVSCHHRARERREVA